jgi:hypothetical protein
MAADVWPFIEGVQHGEDPMRTVPRRVRAGLLALTANLLPVVLALPALAEGGEAPPAQYVNLPSRDQAGDLATTGSLPGPHGAAGFHGRVEQGRIIVRAIAPTKCLPGNLRDVVADVAARFGTVSIESTHRSPSRNWRAGGARRSLHLSCRAVDFRVRGRARGVLAYLLSRPEVGGLKVYRNGIIHVDNGVRRSW